MPTVLGRQVGPTGYGTMRMTWNTTLPSQETCFETLNTALELGANFWNAGELYGTPEYNSCHLLQAYFEKYPQNADKVLLSIKGGNTPGQFTPDGSEENIRRSVDECLRLLKGTKSIDIFECARQDPKTTIEHTVTILAKLVKEGKIGGIGLSEVDGETIRRAYKVHPIAAVEVELSLWSLDIFENDVAKACAELNIPIIAYSPLGRGAFTGEIANMADIPEGDFRRLVPKFHEGNYEHNMKLIQEIVGLAKRKGVAPAQIALAWVRSLSNKPGLPTIIPIPGGTTKDKVIQNTQGVETLTDKEMAEIDSILKEFEVKGTRY